MNEPPSPSSVPKLIVVVPCYNEEDMIPVSRRLFADELSRLIEAGQASPESRILYVDDGSTDKTWRIIQETAAADPRSIGIRQSRNRGHQCAMWAGLMEALSLGCDVTITIDCDGQDDVNAMSAMLAEHAKGADVVYGVRNDRTTDTFFKRFTAESFYRFQAAMGVEAVYNHADYRLLSARALAALAQYREVNLYLRGLVPLIGFKSAQVFYARGQRLAGQGHFGLFRMLAFASDGITSLTIRPIRFVLVAGLFLAFAGLIGLLALGIARLAGAAPAGTAFLAGLVAFVGGLNLVGIGIVGEYAGKSYLEAKNRPRTIVSDRTWDTPSGK